MTCFCLKKPRNN